MQAPRDLMAAAQRADIREDIDRLADRGWLVSVWHLSRFEFQLSSEERIRFGKHLELLHIYWRSMREIAGAASWSQDVLPVDLATSLIHEIDEKILELASLIHELKEKIPEGERDFLQIYEAIPMQMIPPRVPEGIYDISSDLLTALLTSADHCLDIIIELETLPPQ